MTKRDYSFMEERIRHLISEGADLEQRMRSVVDVLWEQLHSTGVSWVGFYLKSSEADEMILGPRRDKPACSPIEMHGACGQAFLKGQPLVVQDVKDLGENYIACDPQDRSEVVIPFGDQTEKPMGVLDLDSHQSGAFQKADVEGLQRVLRVAGIKPMGFVGGKVRDG